MTVSIESDEFVSGAPLLAWQRLLRSHCVLAGALDAELQSRHGLTLSDYDVLVQLRDAEHCSLPMSELSRRTLLTRSGMTRLVQGLQNDGLVERRACTSDARVSYAVLTPVGHDRLAEARRTHHDGIRRLFADRLSRDEAQQVADILGRIPGVLDDPDGCADMPG